MMFILRWDGHREVNNEVLSYDDTESDEDEIDALSRFTTALRFNISNTSYLKLEYQIFTEATERFEDDSLFSPELYYAQLVITF